MNGKANTPNVSDQLVHILNQRQMQNSNEISAPPTPLLDCLDMDRKGEDFKGEDLFWSDCAKPRGLADTGSRENLGFIPSLYLRILFNTRMGAELDRLQKVFQDKYNYDVARETVASNNHSTASAHQPARESLNPRDKVDELLIIHYASHSFNSPRDNRNPVCVFQHPSGTDG